MDFFCNLIGCASFVAAIHFGTEMLEERRQRKSAEALAEQRRVHIERLLALVFEIKSALEDEGLKETG